MRLGIGCRFLREPSRLAIDELASESMRDGTRDLVLQRKYPVHLTLVGIRPEMNVVAHVDELGGDPDHASLAANASFQQGPYVEPLADLSRVEVRPAERERGGARNDP